jgi:hypothetical protein
VSESGSANIEVERHRILLRGKLPSRSDEGDGAFEPRNAGSPPS